MTLVFYKYTCKISEKMYAISSNLEVLISHMEIKKLFIKYKVFCNIYLCSPFYSAGFSARKNTPAAMLTIAQSNQCPTAVFECSRVSHGSGRPIFEVDPHGQRYIVHYVVSARSSFLYGVIIAICLFGWKTPLDWSIFYCSWYVLFIQCLTYIYI